MTFQGNIVTPIHLFRSTRRDSGTFEEAPLTMFARCWLDSPFYTWLWLLLHFLTSPVTKQQHASRDPARSVQSLFEGFKDRVGYSKFDVLFYCIAL